MGRVGDRLVDGGEAAGALVLAAFLENGLAGAVGVQLVSGLGIQPGHGAAQTQTLGGDHAAVGGGEGLAHDAGEVTVNGLVGHGRQTVVALVVPGHSHLVTELLRLGSVGNQGDLALVHNGVELVHDHNVQNLGEVLQPQTCFVSRVADTDTDLIALAGVHDAFHVVEPCVELPLDNGLEVHLHLLAGNLNVGRQSQILGLIEVGADDGDLVILDFIQFPHHHQLGSGVLGRPDLVVHVGLADDLALKGSGEGHGDGQLLHLDLDVPQLQRLLHGLGVVAYGLQSAGNLILAGKPRAMAPAPAETTTESMAPKVLTKAGTRFLV